MGCVGVRDLGEGNPPVPVSRQILRLVVYVGIFFIYMMVKQMITQEGKENQTESLALLFEKFNEVQGEVVEMSLNPELMDEAKFRDLKAKFKAVRSYGDSLVDESEKQVFGLISDYYENAQIENLYVVYLYKKTFDIFGHFPMEKRELFKMNAENCSNVKKQISKNQIALVEMLKKSSLAFSGEENFSATNKLAIKVIRDKIRKEVPLHQKSIEEMAIDVGEWEGIFKFLEERQEEWEWNEYGTIHFEDAESQEEVNRLFETFFQNNH